MGAMCPAYLAPIVFYVSLNNLEAAANLIFPQSPILCGLRADLAFILLRLILSRYSGDEDMFQCFVIYCKKRLPCQLAALLTVLFYDAWTANLPLLTEKDF